MLTDALQPTLRAAVSYVPSTSLIRLRELRDLPAMVRRRPHESDFLALRSWGVTSPVILDVGANRGQSIRSFRCVTTAAVLHSVEPNPFLAAHLRRAHRSDTRVHVYQLAIADHVGHMDLYLPRYGHTVYDTRASLGPEAPREFLDSRHFRPFRAERAHVEGVSVEVSTLDSLDVAPDLLKVDVEGADDGVIAGGAQLLDRHHPVVLVEHPKPETVTLLDAHGYTIHAFDASTGRLRRGRRGELNSYFLRPEHLARFKIDVD
jgi:FkbM family methyltransferase